MIIVFVGYYLVITALATLPLGQANLCTHLFELSI